MSQPAKKPSTDFDGPAAGTPAGRWPHALDTGAVDIALHRCLQQIEPLWRQLEAAGDATVFQTWDYLSRWQRHIGTRIGSRPVVAVAALQGRPALLLPLALDRAGPLRRLRFLGQDLADYNAPIVARDFARAGGGTAFPGIWRRVLAEIGRDPALGFDFVDLRKMPETVGAQANPMVYLPVRPNPHRAHLARLGADWESFYAARRSSATRRRDRTKLRRLSDHGEVTLRVAEDPGEIAAAVTEMFALKAEWFARQGILDVFARSGTREFFHDLTITGGGIAEVARLVVGGVTAAAALGLVFGGRYHYVVAAYDAGPLSQWGPGAALLRALMERAIARGLTEFDFTIGDEAYKADWCDGTVRLFDLIEARAWRGWPAAVAVREIQTGKRLAKTYPALWRAAQWAQQLTSPAGSARQAE